MSRKLNNNEPRPSREVVGHSRVEAAEVLGVAERTIEGWETGQNPMPAPMLRLYRHLVGLERIPFRKWR